MAVPLFQCKKLRPRWRFQVAGSIWRILFTRNGLVMGEERAGADGSARFFCVNADSGAPLWRDRALNERRWIGIEACGETVLFLHEFAKPDLPVHRGVTALDLQTGELLWRDPEAVFSFEIPGFAIIRRDGIERSRYQQLDERTGVVVKDFGDDASAVNALRSSRGADEELREPVVIDDGPGLMKELAPLIGRHCGGDRRRGPVEILPAGEHVVVAYHVDVDQPGAGREERLAHHLKVIHRPTSRELFGKMLLNDLRYPALGTFTLRNGILYFVERRSTLVALPLDE